MSNYKPQALVLIDLQQGFYHPSWGVRNNPSLEKNVSSLLRLFREQSLPVIHVRHNSLEPQSPLKKGEVGFEFIPEARPANNEVIMEKRRHSAFIGTPLLEHLHSLNCEQPVFAGLTTDHCVSTTVRMAHDFGLSPTLVADATATFPRNAWQKKVLSADEVWTAALASLDGEFATVVNALEISQKMGSSL